MIRSILRKSLPKMARLRLRTIARWISDFLNGYHHRFSKSRLLPNDMPYSLCLQQDIKKSHFYKNKISNLNLAIEKINNTTVKENEIFSFWQLIGSPDAKRGFKIGRNIVNGKLSEEYGGGLCQISGIIYHLSLISGLEVLERHSHSIDIYTDETRFTPIGTDATVVYGYKDLRLINNLGFPISFQLSIKGNQIYGCLLSKEVIKQQQVTFKNQIHSGYMEVTAIDQTGKVVGFSRYQN